MVRAISVSILLIASQLIVMGCSETVNPDIQSTPTNNTSATYCKPGGTPYLDSDLAPQICSVIFFSKNSSVFDDTAHSSLEWQSYWLKKYPAIKINIDAYCDKVGTHKHNLWLARQRALAVKNYYISHGIEISRIHINVRGDDVPPKSFLNADPAWQRVTITSIAQ